jgi:hypothetical protein
MYIPTAGCAKTYHLTSERKLFENQANKLRLWQKEIGEGKTPSFDFYKP